jgi:hypothetical protein
MDSDPAIFIIDLQDANKKLIKKSFSTYYFLKLHLHHFSKIKSQKEVTHRETERGGPCRPIETEVNRDSRSTYDRVSFLGYVPKVEGVIAYSSGNIVH